MKARGGAEAEGMRLKAQAFSQYGEVPIHIHQLFLSMERCIFILIIAMHRRYLGSSGAQIFFADIWLITYYSGGESDYGIVAVSVENASDRSSLHYDSPL